MLYVLEKQSEFGDASTLRARIKWKHGNHGADIEVEGDKQSYIFSATTTSEVLEFGRFFRRLGRQCVREAKRRSR